MQPIERYGVVALLFLVATFTAVLVMGESTPTGADSLEQKSAQLAKADPGAPSPNPSADRRLRMKAGIQAAPLERGSFPQQRAEQEEAAAQAQQRLLQERALRAEFERERLAQLERERVRLAANQAAARGGFGQGGADSGARQAAPREASREASGLRKYKVKRGDTLGEIALAELGTSKVWKLITEVNEGLTPAKLIVDRTILLPSQASVEAALLRRSKPTESVAALSKKTETKKEANVDPGTSVTYTVSEGESLWRIAQRSLGDGKRFNEIVKLNPGINPDSLRVGQKLNLPVGAKSAAAAAPSPSAPIAQDKGSAQRTGRVR